MASNAANDVVPTTSLTSSDHTRPLGTACTHSGRLPAPPLCCDCVLSAGDTPTCVSLLGSVFLTL